MIKTMKIGIIGAGYTGLVAGYRLAQKGHDVTIFEASDKVGGLARGFKEKKWKWALDEHYHHWFTEDRLIKRLAKDIGHEIFFKRPETSTLYNGKVYQLDSPISLLKFPEISFVSRLRTGLVLFYLKYLAPWGALENIRASKFIKATMGKDSWDVLWKPLFLSKFGKYANEISTAWFWARIKKRTPSLGYPVGGFEEFGKSIEKQLKKFKGKVLLEKRIISIQSKKAGVSVACESKIYNFDKVICTLPIPAYLKMTKGLPKKYQDSLKRLKGIGAATMVLSLKHKFFDEDTYWLNVNDKGNPFLAIVEHTNFVDKKYYNNERLLYVGNYLETTDENFALDKNALYKVYEKYLKKINPSFKKNWINKIYLFKSSFAQPVFPLGYSKIIPSIETPLPGLYLANMQQIYPWDRGTEFAVELGEKAAKWVSEK